MTAAVAPAAAARPTLDDLVLRVRKWVDGHKVLVLSAAVLLVAVAIVVVTAQRADAASLAERMVQATWTPAQWTEHYTELSQGGDLRAASDVLLWNRWFGVNSVGMADVQVGIFGGVMAGMTLITSLFLMMASFIVYVIGQFIVIGVSIQILDRATGAINRAFGSIVSEIMGPSSNTEGVCEFPGDPGCDTRQEALDSSLILIVAGLFLVFILFRTVRAVMASGVQAGVWTGVRGLLGGVIAFLVLGIMGWQAQHSQNEDYAIGSPGWIIETGADIGNGISVYVNGVVDSFVETVENGVTLAREDGQDESGETTNTQAGECEMYVDALHYYWPESESQIPLQYDRLVRAMYFGNWRIAAFGESSVSNGSWCRIAEMMAGSPAGSQIAIAQRTATIANPEDTDMSGPHLYQDAIDPMLDGELWQSATGEGNARNIVGLGEDAMTPGPDSGFAAANRLFGPNFTSDGGIDKANTFWSACRWVTSEGELQGSVRISEHWDQVIAMPDRPPWYVREVSLGNEAVAETVNSWLNNPEEDEDAEVLSVEACREVVTGEGVEDGGYNGDNDLGNVGLDRGATGEREDNYGIGYKFRFSEPTIEVPGLVSFRVSTNSGLFQNEQSPEALEYYMNTQGLLGPLSAASAAMGLAFMIAVTKFMVPIVIGGVVAQGIGIAIWVAVPIVLLLMAFRTTNGGKLGQIGRGTFMAIAWSVLAVVLYAVVLNLLLAMFNLFRALLVDPTANSLWQMLQIALAGFLAFWLTKGLLKNVMSYDMTSFSGAVRSAAGFAGRGAMQGLGMDPGTSPFRASADADKGRGVGNLAKDKADAAWGSLKDSGRGGLENIKNSLLGRTNDKDAEVEKKDDKGKGEGQATPEKKDLGPAAAPIQEMGEKAGVFAPAGTPVAGDGSKAGIGAAGAKGPDDGKVSWGGIGHRSEEELAAELSPEDAAGVIGAVGGGPSSNERVPDVERALDDFHNYGPEGSLAEDPEIGGTPEDARAMQADLFNGIAPVNADELSVLAPHQRDQYGEKQLDGISIPTGEPSDRAYSYPDSDVNPEAVIDPQTGMFIDPGLVESGTPGARGGDTTEAGTTFVGLNRSDDGEWTPILDGVRHTPQPFPFEREHAPEGIEQGTWDSTRDLQEWMASNPEVAHALPMYEWPEDRRLQAEALAPQMDEVYAALGREIPEIRDDEMLRSGMGLSASPESLADRLQIGSNPVPYDRDQSLQETHARLSAIMAEQAAMGRVEPSALGALDSDTLDLDRVRDVAQTMEGPESSEMMDLLDQFSVDLAAAGQDGTGFETEMQGIMAGVQDARAESLRGAAASRVEVARRTAAVTAEEMRRTGMAEIQSMVRRGEAEINGIETKMSEIRGRMNSGDVGLDNELQSSLDELQRRKEEIATRTRMERSDISRRMVSSVGESYDKASREEIDAVRGMYEGISSSVDENASGAMQRLRERIANKTRVRESVERSKQWFSSLTGRSS